jgi:hypothetical protein
MKRPLTLLLSMALLVPSCSRGSSNGAADGLFFPTAGGQGEVVMAALFQGPLVVEDGCILAGKGTNLALPIWRDGYTAERDGSGRVVVLDPDGATVAIEGQEFEMGGGYIAEFRPSGKVAMKADQVRQVAQMTGIDIPARCLPDDVYGVWWVGDTQAVSG